MTDEKKKILVTGAGGFLGYHLANYLCGLGHEVAGIDLHFPDPQQAGKALFQAISSDFRNWEITKKILSGKDVVFHLASAHLQISLNEEEYWDVNVKSLRTLLELSSDAGIKRFIHTSSVGAYGNLTTWPADENTPCHPQSIYGETKLAGEQEVIRFGAESNLPYVILRPAWVYGPGCPRTTKLYRMLRKKRFIMIGQGNNKRHPIYIKDMLEAYRLSMLRNEALSELMIIGGNQIITTRELIDNFSRVLGLPGPLLTLPYPVGVLLATVSEVLFGLLKKEPPVSRRTLEFFDTNNAFDISKSKKLLAFEPQFDFASGLRDCAAVLKNI